MNNSNLEFRKIKSLNFLYEVNENGTIIRNVKSKKQLKIVLDMHHSKVGYYRTLVHNKNISDTTIRVMIHRVVAECWLGDCPEGYEVDHIDRNPHNNDYRNLRYVTKGEQMKNRDHSNISKIGSENLARARALRAKPVKLYNEQEEYYFTSYADCSRFLEQKYENITFEQARYRLKAHREKIYDYYVEYLRNAETKHDRSTEQEIVHESDLTGNYKTAFNWGKQKETEARVKHVNQMEM